MGRLPDATIEEIRDRVDIVEVVGRFVSLKRAGRNYKGLCPFHQEKTPSFNVNPDRQIFHCFGCDAGGNVFTFLTRHENLTFPEAVRTLARECGVAIPESERGEPGLSEQLHRALGAAQGYFRSSLAAAAGAPARAYLAQRGIDAEAAERAGVGFVPDRWDGLVRALAGDGIASEIGERAGLLAARESGGHYDRLRGRVTFPIRDARGRVIAFGGRALRPDQEPKYLNTPESPVFRKREAFFGFPHALEAMRRQEQAVVVEGYFDVLALWRAGIDQAIATCGTALTPEHAQGLRRRTPQVVLVFDGDEAGQRAIDRALEVLLPHELRVRAAVLPPRDDPDTLLAREGASALAEIVGAAPPALDAVIERAVAGGCRSPWEKADAVAAVAPLLALIRDPVERGAFVQQLAFAARAEPRHVEQAVRAARAGDREGARKAAVPAGPRRAGPVERNLATLARVLLAHPAQSARLPRDEILSLVERGPHRELVAAVIDAGRQAERVDVAELADRLEADACRLLTALAADECAIDEDAAAQTIDDTVAWLRKRRRNERERALTRRFEDPAADAAALLAAKERQLEERRAALVQSRGSPP